MATKVLGTFSLPGGLSSTQLLKLASMMKPQNQLSLKIIRAMSYLV